MRYLVAAFALTALVASALFLCDWGPIWPCPRHDVWQAAGVSSPPVRLLSMRFPASDRL